jgi:hypothetical protein
MPNSALESLLHPPEVVVKFIKRLISEYRNYQGPERRTETRSCVSVPVTIQFLDEDYRPVSEPLPTVTHNLSGGGIGVVLDDPMPCNLIQVRLTLKSGETMNLIASVRHCTQTGDHFQVGARFVVKWDDVNRSYRASDRTPPDASLD